MLTGAARRRLTRRDHNHTLFHSFLPPSQLRRRACGHIRTNAPDTQHGASPHVDDGGEVVQIPTALHGKTPRVHCVIPARFGRPVTALKSALDDPHLHFRLHVSVQLDRDLVDAECFDRLVQVDLTLFDVQTLRLQLLRDVAGGH